MKRKYIFAALVLLSIMAFAYIASANANEWSPSLTNNKQGTSWIITPFPGTFNCKDVDPASIHAYVSLDGVTVTEIPIKNVAIHLDYIKLSFAQNAIPQHAIFNNVVGQAGSDTFTANGPGWTWGNIR